MAVLKLPIINEAYKKCPESPADNPGLLDYHRLAVRSAVAYDIILRRDSGDTANLLDRLNRAQLVNGRNAVTLAFADTNNLLAGMDIDATWQWLLERYEGFPNAEESQWRLNSPISQSTYSVWSATRSIFRPPSYGKTSNTAAIRERYTILGNGSCTETDVTSILCGETSDNVLSLGTATVYAINKAVARPKYTPSANAEKYPALGRHIGQARK